MEASQAKDRSLPRSSACVVAARLQPVFLRRKDTTAPQTRPSCLLCSRHRERERSLRLPAIPEASTHTHAHGDMGRLQSTRVLSGQGRSQFPSSCSIWFSPFPIPANRPRSHQHWRSAEWNQPQVKHLPSGEARLISSTILS